MHKRENAVRDRKGINVRLTPQMRSAIRLLAAQQDMSMNRWLEKTLAPTIAAELRKAGLSPLQSVGGEVSNYEV
jgi:hypothetical protein